MDTADEQRFCELCGAALAPGARFCQRCGAHAELPVLPSSAPARQSMVPAIILLGAAVLLAGGSAGWWLLQHKARPPRQNPPATGKLPGSSKLNAPQDSAGLLRWWEAQPWMQELKQTMPRGITLVTHAEPFDAEGWSEVGVREAHAPDSGFDPEVSPMVGLFRVSRAERKIEWMEPVSDEYQPLDGFLRLHGLKSGPGGPASPAK